MGVEFTDNKSPNDVFPPEWVEFPLLFCIEEHGKILKEIYKRDIIKIRILFTPTKLHEIFETFDISICYLISSDQVAEKKPSYEIILTFSRSLWSPEAHNYC